jgi:exopolysaccharide production protein ExoY
VREFVVKPSFSGDGAHPYGGGLTPLGGLSKRTFDIVVAVSALVIQAPIMVAIAVFVRVWIGKPVISAQERVGFGGRKFPCYEFCTSAGSSKGGPERQFANHWQKTCSLDIVWVATLAEALRRSSLDKLPQLVNVLRGDMSLVGPRPILAHQIPRYGARAPEYFAARPGLTGLCQSSDRTCIALDRYYVRNWSMRLDLALLMKTISAAHNASGAA